MYSIYSSLEELTMTKFCGKCLKEKSKTLFSASSKNKDGLQAWCKKCNRDYGKLLYSLNPKLFSIRAKARRDKNHVKHLAREKKWRDSNKEIKRNHNKEWKIKNRPKVNFATAKRRALKLLSMPKWANKRRIESVYKAAILKPGFVVDHIIPLKGKTVCGLHVENNLSIISAKENTEKNNKLLPEFSTW